MLLLNLRSLYLKTILDPLSRADPAEGGSRMDRRRLEEKEVTGKCIAKIRAFVFSLN